jgi:hypothetical protein
MKVKFIFAWLVILSVGIQPLFAQAAESADEEIHETGEEFVIAVEADEEPALAIDADADEEPALATVEELDLDDIRNNPYFLESRRLAKLAEETYDYGDYVTSEKLAREASRYAEQSDVYVAMVIAKYRLDQAAASGASKQYPAEYSEAQGWYAKSVTARDNEEWGSALEAANKTIDMLAALDLDKADVPPVDSSPFDDGPFPLPATYTVRLWDDTKDCFWNIAGRPWVYGDPHKWRTLYNANKSKLPNPNNPNWLEPGIVLDIPAISGETREGEWEEDRTYSWE